MSQEIQIRDFDQLLRWAIENGGLSGDNYNVNCVAVDYVASAIKDGVAKLTALKDLKCLRGKGKELYSLCEDPIRWSNPEMAKKLGVYFWRDSITTFWGKEIWGIGKDGHVIGAKVYLSPKTWAFPREFADRVEPQALSWSLTSEPHIVQDLLDYSKKLLELRREHLQKAEDLFVQMSKASLAVKIRDGFRVGG